MGTLVKSQRSYSLYSGTEVFRFGPSEVTEGRVTDYVLGFSRYVGHRSSTVGVLDPGLRPLFTTNPLSTN